VVIGGATKEPLDDVRFLSAYSTGTTAIELAKSAFEKGAEVELWMGRSEERLPDYIPTKRFSTTKELSSMVKKLDCDYCLVPAAISDYSPSKAKGKISSNKKELKVSMKPVPKVIEAIRKRSNCFLVGFKAEHSISKKELISRAMKRLKSARLDMIVANDLNKVERKTSEVIIIDKKGRWTEAKGSKVKVAEKIWKAIEDGVG
jgi:phosphopantothenoylcysteine decarboxylase/phosphopantothenate--cysteine ligase